MPHTLPKLPYAYGALEPYLDAKTLEIHYGKHHQAYVDNLNKTIADYPDLQRWSVEELIARIAEVPAAIQQAVRNNAGGHLNHWWYWLWMAPKGGAPNGKLAKEINKTFGSLDAFKEQFTKAGLTRFGSGWAWLVVRNGKLEITSSSNQDSPLTDGAYPILGCDVWEHAYYLKYQNRRAEYLAAWWNVVNWQRVADLYHAQAKSGK